MSKYFSTTVIPDIINGDVSDIVGTSVGSDCGDAAFAANDILFDWTAFDIPRGASKLSSIMIYMMGEDGATQADNVDISFLFAKTEDGVAPTSLGETNAAHTAGFDMPTHLIGATTLNVATDDGGHAFGPAFGTISISGAIGNNESWSPVILQGEPNTGTAKGYDKIYVAAFCKAGIDFSTGVKPDAQATTSTDTISVDGVDPRKCFQIGDTVYTNTDDTALGTVKSLASGSIVLNANLAAQVEDNEEIVNANPIRITFGFEQ